MQTRKFEWGSSRAVEAVQVFESNAQQVAEWSGSRFIKDQNSPYEFIYVITPSHEAAREGDWVIKWDNKLTIPAFWAERNETFLSEFREI